MSLTDNLTPIGVLTGRLDIGGNIPLSVLNYHVFNEISGNSVTFNTDLVNGLISLKCNINYTQSGTGTPSLSNIRTINGYTSMTITDEGTTTRTTTVDMSSVNDIICEADIDVISGRLCISKLLYQKAVSEMNNNEDYPGWINSGLRKYLGEGLNRYFDGSILNVGTSFAANTTNNQDLLIMPTNRYGGLKQSEWKSLYPDLIVQIAVPLQNKVWFDITPATISLFSGSNTIYTNVNGSVNAQYVETVRNKLGGA